MSLPTPKQVKDFNDSITELTTLLWDNPDGVTYEVPSGSHAGLLEAALKRAGWKVEVSQVTDGSPRKLTIHP